jgi:hypothetical protein
MGEQQGPDDVQRSFRLVMGIIAVILLIGVATLITTVIVYRNSPGRHFPFFESTPTAPISTPSPS